jgi:TetR/AcrR family transcriptional regulator, fatty acid biosynthesis regulator
MPSPAVAAPARRRLAPEERSAQILDVAARLLLEEGFTEVSMERLGRDAGISKALVYNYFPNRNDLLRALLEREIGLLRSRQAEAASTATDFRELVHHTTRIYIEHVSERGQLLSKLWAEPAVARSLADENLRSRDEAKRFMARQVTREYGLPRDVALSAVDMQMAMTEAAAQHLARTHGDVATATDLCVTLLLGGLEALAKAHGKGSPAGTQPRRRASAARSRS